MGTRGISSSAAATVNNVAPTVAFTGGDTTVDESGVTEHTYTYSISDPGDDTVSSVSTDCGTGGTKVALSDTNTNTLGSFKCKFPDGPASPTVTAQATDSDFDSGNTAIRAVTVANVAPTVAFTGGDTTVDESGVTEHTYSYSISDPGDDTISSVSTSCGTGGTKVVSSDSNTNTSGSFKCKFLDGPASPTVTASATDSDAATSNTAMLAVTGNNVAPTVSAAFAAPSVSCGASNATLYVSFSDPGMDTHTATVDWGDSSGVQSLGTVTSPFSQSHTYAAAGPYNAAVTVTDSDSDSGSDGTNAVTVNFTIVGGGILPPVKQDASSVFKSRSTIPVKIQAQDCNGSFPSNLAPQIRVYKTSGQTPSGDAIEVDSTSVADTGGVLRFTGAPDYQYIYNMAAKSLPDASASYLLEVTIPLTNQKIYANFGLRP